MNDIIPTEELLEQQKTWAKKVKIGGRYQHFRNHHFYVVQSLSVREEDNSWSVNYTDELSGLLFNRRAEIFVEEIPDESGKIVQRFKKVEEK
ncbi:DUF1653 domain-containing protein [Candidatus Saccharibacteria bacterium]|nr:DUF1653 domain-containing protein [Candidatus Saccharibacteria bacterium]